MFENRLSLIALRACTLAISLALAGCGGGSGDSTGGPSSIPNNGTPSETLSPPASLSATAGNAQATLTWSSSTGALSYAVKRSNTSGGPYTQIATPGSTSYTDTPLTNGQTYYYVVSALNGGTESANSSQVSALPAAVQTAVPPAPTALSATAGDTRVNLTWSASGGATSYNVKRATTAGGPYATVASPTSNSYSDTHVTNGTLYYYVVSAVDAGGESANSAQASAQPAAAASNPPPSTFGTWVNVTPSGVDLNNNLCGNYGTSSIQVDPMHPSNLYTSFDCQGVWKSTDYGLTWSGPIDTGTAPSMSDNAGAITIAPSSTKTVPTIFRSVIRGSGTGFWKSVDGGVNWTKYPVAASSTSRQDYYAPVVDPYDENHLLMTGHEQDVIAESVDGGQTWTAAPLNNGMLQSGGTGRVFFLNTGNATTTRGTWLWLAQQSGGTYGTWRTTNSGTNWVKVDNNEHPHGNSQIFQPDTNGVVYMGGAYSAFGWGVLRSTDYGQTWTHVGQTNNETAVWGTSKNIYAMYGYPVGPGGSNFPAFETAAQPGTGTWVAPAVDPNLSQGVSMVAVINDGTHNIFVGAMWNSGIWRYIEP